MTFDLILILQAYMKGEEYKRKEEAGELTDEEGEEEDEEEEGENREQNTGRK